MHYRTEIEVTGDRYVCLQLPDFIPPGRATVTVAIIEVDPGAGPVADDDRFDRDDDADADDVEWWDDLDGDDRPA